MTDLFVKHNCIVAFTESGGEISITAYTKDSKQIWKHVEKKKKDHLGHYVYPVDARNGEAGLGGQVHWFDARGNLLPKGPANPLNGNPDFVKGDWKGRWQRGTVLVQIPVDR